MEADLIKAHENIITYEKQGKEKIPATLTDEQINDLSNDLEKIRAKIRDNCRTAPYTQKGVNQLTL